MYDSYINKQTPIDAKQSLYYLELMHLYSAASECKSSDELLLIQDKIDRLFMETLPQKSAMFKDVIVGIYKVVYEVKKLLSNLPIDVDFLVNALGIELFKLSRDDNGVELQVFINRVVNTLGVIDPDDKIEVCKLVHYVVSSLLVKSNYWNIKLIKESKRNRTVIVPSCEFYDKFKCEAQLISIDLPRVVFNDSDLERAGRYSHKNVASRDTTANDVVVDTLKRLGSVPYEINEGVYNWLRNNKSV